MGKKQGQASRRYPVRPAGRFFEAKAALILVAFLVMASAVMTGFYRLQITESQALAARASNQQYVTQRDQTRRGMILDRNGYPLVLSSYVFRVGITPSDVYTRVKEIRDRDIVDRFGLHLGLDEEACQEILEIIRADRSTGWTGLEKKLSGHESRPYVTIATEVPEPDAMALRDWLDENRVGGVRFDPEERRVYNNGLLGSSVLGLTKMEGGRIRGVSGLEAAYDQLLSGEPGYRFAKRNNYTTRGVTPFSRSVDSPGEKGRNLVTSLDMEIMAILQEELLSVAAAAGLIADVNGLVMDVTTGDVLAMSQLAPFDLSSPDAVPVGFTDQEWALLDPAGKTAYLSSNLWNNVNITDLYEPGSVFKAVTLAIALEEGVVSEDSVFNDNPMQIQGETIVCHTGYGHGDETLREAFFRSCNPVFVQVGDRVGRDLYYSWIRRLGLYGTTGIDLPMETAGYLHADPMAIDFANLTFGESSTLTAIQMAQLFAALGNGGYRVTPRLGIGSTDDGLESMMAFDLQEANQIFSKETCGRVRSMLMDVVRRGTATGTFGAMGLNLGGKTGTAVDSHDGRKTFSFVGLAPCDQPRYVVLISVHKPETTDALGSAAARAANRVAARILNLKGYRQSYSNHELALLSQSVELPDLTGLTVGQAALALSRLQLAPSVDLEHFYLDRKLARMVPGPGTQVGAGSRVWLYPEGVDEVEWVAVPDFRGRNYHECVWLAADYGVTLIPEGWPGGLAVEQSLPPTLACGAPVERPDETGSPCSPDQETTVGRVRQGQVITVRFSVETEADGRD